MDGICGNFFCAFDKIRQDLQGCLRKIFCARIGTERGQNRQEAAQSGDGQKTGNEMIEAPVRQGKGDSREWSNT